MGTLHNVLHTGARPIGLHEFLDAVRATCKPRFPHTRGSNHRRVAIAVSGGVDSMALAFLCSQVRKHDPDFRISDNPVSGFRGLYVDHGLREESYEEGLAVRDALDKMGFLAEILPLNWTKTLGDEKHPKDLPNFESVARTLRYQKLGHICAFRNIATLLLAHHEDDQYETVLMRLLQGHGSRGLRGMSNANDIPECKSIHGAYRSGFVDDQKREHPFYNTRPSNKERKHRNRALKANINRLMAEAALNEGIPDVLSNFDVEDFYESVKHTPVKPAHIDVEDGGVFVYRPLLEFSKDRLIATCLENNVPWWEDATNKDPTLTMRNAIRHLYRGYTLPKALQKPAILALNKRCEQRAQAQEAEAGRLLSRTIIHDFEPIAGTATVQFPNYGLPLTRKGGYSLLRRRARFLKQKKVAAILMRKILLLVSPELQTPHLTTLENHVHRLFPSLAGPEEAAVANSPKAFSMSGVFLMPVVSSSGRTAGQPLTWYLSRTPYSSTAPLPRVRTPYWATECNRKRRYIMSPRMPWALWDGRYWIHIEHRVPYRLVVQPFLLEHAKSFRELLTPDDRQRLATYLKRYAPGKVRFTLPAIYIEEDLDLDNPIPRPYYPNPAEYGEGDDEKDFALLHPRVLDNSKMKLVALPTLDIQLPRLDEWLSYEIRYRNLGRDTLQVAGSYSKGPFASLRGTNRRRVLRSAMGLAKTRGNCSLASSEERIGRG